MASDFQTTNQKSRNFEASAKEGYAWFGSSLYAALPLTTNSVVYHVIECFLKLWITVWKSTTTDFCHYELNEFDNFLKKNLKKWMSNLTKTRKFFLLILRI